MLLDHHRAMLKASAISDAVVAARGYFSMHSDMSWPGPHELAGYQQRYPALGIPYYRLGDLYTMGIRPEEPRTKPKPNGGIKTMKYEWPEGVPTILDVPPYTMTTLLDRRCPLFISEGAKKIDAIFSHFADCAVASVNGVWGWQKKDADGNHELLGCFSHIPLRNRIVVIAFDSDARNNPNVRGALNNFRLGLMRRGATVGVMDLSSLVTLDKVGVDDALGMGTHVQKLGSLISYTRIDDNDRRLWQFIRSTDPFEAL